jgi:hypothetical protein
VDKNPVCCGGLWRRRLIPRMEKRLDWLRKESKGRVSFTGLKVASNESLGRVCFAATDFHAAGVTVIFFSSA